MGFGIVTFMLYYFYRASREALRGNWPGEAPGNLFIKVPQPALKKKGTMCNLQGDALLYSLLLPGLARAGGLLTSERRESCMGLYERLLEEARKERTTDSERAGSVGTTHRGWREPVPEAGGYITVEDLEQEQERLQQEWRRVEQQEQERRSKELGILRKWTSRGVRSAGEGMAFKSLQKKYPLHYDQSSTLRPNEVGA